MLKKAFIVFVITSAFFMGIAFAEEKINLNKATAEQLEMLQGVGPTIAQAIISYRNEHGPFNSINELVNVNGIGDKKMAKLAESLTIEE